MRALLLLAACACVRTASGQEPPETPSPQRFHLYVSGSIGLARRQQQPWQAIHLALRPGIWDAYYPRIECTPYCADASDAAVGRPLALSVAVRYHLHRAIYLRAFAALMPLGAYPGSDGVTQLTIAPSSDVAGVQGGVMWRGLWLEAGPTLNAERVIERAGDARQASSGIRAGASFSGGLLVFQHRSMFIEVTVERRIAGSVSLAPLAVPGTQTIPGMRVPLSHTLLGIGVGLRK